jgi:PIN domain nuclease of toxin-antitoxin system
VRLLLDTHIWLWCLLAPERLVPSAVAQLDDVDAELWLSPISVWEALVLAAKGRVVLDGPATDWVDKQLRVAPLRDAPLTREVAIRSRDVELPHDDPADRFLAATAAVYDLTLVTADSRLIDCRSIHVLANR